MRKLVFKVQPGTSLNKIVQKLCKYKNKELKDIRTRNKLKLRKGSFIPHSSRILVFIYLPGLLKFLYGFHGR